LKLRRELFGAAAVEQRANALGEFGAPLQHIINAYAYGDIWSRPGLPLATKSLAMIAMMAAAGKPAELRVTSRRAEEWMQARRYPRDLAPGRALLRNSDRQRGAPGPPSTCCGSKRRNRPTVTRHAGKSPRDCQTPRRR